MERLDGYVAAIVDGPVSISPPEWIFHYSPSPNSTMVAAGVRGDLRRRGHYNDISNVLSVAISPIVAVSVPKRLAGRR